MNLNKQLKNNHSVITPLKEGCYHFLKGVIQVSYRLNGELYLLKGISAPAVLVVCEQDVNIEITELDNCCFSFIETFDQDIECDVESKNIFNVNELVNQLKAVTHMMHHLLSSASSEFIQDLFHYGEFHHIDSGEILFEQNSKSDSVYFLINGKLEAFINPVKPIVVGYIARGEIFGEMGVLSNVARTTAIRASRHSEVLKIPAEYFVELQKKYSQLNDFITTTLIQRLDKQNRSVKSQHKPLTRIIIPLTSVGIDDLSWMKTELPTDSRVLRLAEVVKAFNCESLNQIHATSLYNYLDKAEQCHHICTYWCEIKQQEWLQLALTRADEIWLVVDELQQPDDIEKLLNDLSVEPRWDSIERVLVRGHKNLTDIQGTAEFLSKYNCQRCFHYQYFDHESQRRVLRFLSNKALGLVLGGGGARGIAHIGLFQVMLENSINVDAVGGTSIGSVMAASISNHWSVAEILQHIRSHFVDINPVGDYTFPFVAISKGRRLNKALKAVFGDVNIEDLPIPFYCVSANISDSSEKVHTTGKLWKAVRASLAIPGVITPAIFEGEFYVDGGLINNLPTNVMGQFKVGSILAHDVSDNEELTSEISRIPSGWPYLWHKISRKKQKVPSILEVLFRSTLLAGVKRTNENIGLADVYLKPDLAHFGMLEFKKAEEIYQFGYQYSLNKLSLGEFETLQAKE